MSIRSKRFSVKAPRVASVVFTVIASGLALQSLAQTQTPATSPDDRYVLGPDSLPRLLDSAAAQV